MSDGWIFLSLIICVLLVGTGVGLWEIRKPKCKEPAEPTPEVGTIRIVEKRRDDGTEYYMPEVRWSRGWKPFTANREGRNWAYIKSDTVAGCQEEVDEELERQKNKAHHKVMGEFTP